MYEVAVWAHTAIGDSPTALSHLQTGGVQPERPLLKSRPLNQTAVECSWSAGGAAVQVGQAAMAHVWSAPSSSADVWYRVCADVRRVLRHLLPGPVPPSPPAQRGVPQPDRGGRRRRAVPVPGESVAKTLLRLSVFSQHRTVCVQVRAIAPFLGPPSDLSVVKMIPNERLPPRNLHRVRPEKTQALLKWQPPYDTPAEPLVGHLDTIRSPPLPQAPSNRFSLSRRTRSTCATRSGRWSGTTR